jgi:hypothetical protein
MYTFSSGSPLTHLADLFDKTPSIADDGYSGTVSRGPPDFCSTKHDEGSVTSQFPSGSANADFILSESEASDFGDRYRSKVS